MFVCFFLDSHQIRMLFFSHVPAELEAKLRLNLPPSQVDVGIDFVNRMQELYVPPKPKFNFANSQGLALGSR
jgi:hypothetical protein